eukprot:g13153.t1
MPSTSSKASNPSKGQLTGTQKSKHKKSKNPDRLNRQNQTNNGGTSSAVHRLRQLKSTHKTRALDRRNSSKSNTTQADTTAPVPSPFTVFQRQAALANSSRDLQGKLPPERMSCDISAAGSLSAREKALGKMANSTQKSTSRENILETSKELDELTSVQLDQLYLNSVENFEHIKSQWQTLHAGVLDSSQVNLSHMKSSSDKLEEELQRSRKEISTLLAALDLTQARFEEKGVELEKLKEKTHTSLLDTHKDIKDHYDVISRKWIDQNKDELIRALYNAKYQSHVMEEELVRSKGESRRDRLAYNNLLNEKFRIIVDKCKEFGELESATLQQMSSMKRRIADLEEEGKIAHEVYKSRLSKLHDKFAKQFVAMKESNSRSCSTTA